MNSAWIVYEHPSYTVRFSGHSLQLPNDGSVYHGYDNCQSPLTVISAVDALELNTENKEPCSNYMADSYSKNHGFFWIRETPDLQRVESKVREGGARTWRII